MFQFEAWLAFVRFHVINEELCKTIAYKKITSS